MKKTKHSFKYYQLWIKLSILSFALDCYRIIRNCFYGICLVVSAIGLILYETLGMLYLMLRICFDQYILRKPTEEWIHEYTTRYNKLFGKLGVSMTEEELFEFVSRKIRR